MSFPCRSKYSWGFTRTYTNRSPAGPPFGPASPCPGILILFPLSIPGGIVTLSFCGFDITPFPLHMSQGFSMMYPSPLQVGHGEAIEKKPELLRTCPLPPQVGHTLRPLPVSAPLPPQEGQVTCRS